MGYTHYWRREPRIEAAVFSKIVKDFSALVPIMAQNGVPLAGGMGEGEPEITSKLQQGSIPAKNQRTGTGLLERP